MSNGYRTRTIERSNISTTIMIKGQTLQRNSKLFLQRCVQLEQSRVQYEARTLDKQVTYKHKSTYTVCSMLYISKRIQVAENFNFSAAEVSSYGQITVSTSHCSYNQLLLFPLGWNFMRFLFFFFVQQHVLWKRPKGFNQISSFQPRSLKKKEKIPCTSPNTAFRSEVLIFFTLLPKQNNQKQ